MQRARVGAAHAIDIVEAAYGLEGTETDWLAGLVGAARKDIDTGDGAYGFTGNERQTEPNFATAPVYVAQELNPGFAERLAELNREAPEGVYDVIAKRVAFAGGLEGTYGKGSPIVEHFRELMRPTGIQDGISFYARDGEYGNVTFAAPARFVVKLPPRVNAVWNRVLLHAAAGLRLRRKLARKATSVAALLEPSGKLHDATSDVPRAALRDAVKAIDRARTKKLRAAPEEALALWQGLVAGEWSLVDHFERGGKRYLAAYRNQPLLVDPRGLATSERAVLRYLDLGASNKEIAFALGLPLGTVSSAVTSLLRKLGVRRRVELAGISDPSRLERLAVHHDDDGELDVLAIEPAPIASDVLTPTEREVAAMVVRGLTNARIATERNVSPKTVMNQVRAIFEKTNVTSRSELAVRLARRGGEPRR